MKKKKNISFGINEKENCKMLKKKEVKYLKRGKNEPRRDWWSPMYFWRDIDEVFFLVARLVFDANRVSQTFNWVTLSACNQLHDSPCQTASLWMANEYKNKAKWNLILWQTTTMKLNFFLFFSGLLLIFKYLFAFLNHANFVLLWFRKFCLHRRLCNKKFH